MMSWCRHLHCIVIALSWESSFTVNFSSPRFHWTPPQRRDLQRGFDLITAIAAITFPFQGGMFFIIPNSICFVDMPHDHIHAHVSFYTHPIPCWWVLDLIRVRAECCLRGSSVLVPVDKVVKFSPALKARFLRWVISWIKQKGNSVNLSCGSITIFEYSDLSFLPLTSSSSSSSSSSSCPDWW